MSTQYSDAPITTNSPPLQILLLTIIAKIAVTAIDKVARIPPPLAPSRRPHIPTVMLLINGSITTAKAIAPDRN